MGFNAAIVQAMTGSPLAARVTADFLCRALPMPYSNGGVLTGLMPCQHELLARDISDRIKNIGVGHGVQETILLNVGMSFERLKTLNDGEKALFALGSFCPRDFRSGFAEGIVLPSDGGFLNHLCAETGKAKRDLFIVEQGVIEFLRDLVFNSIMPLGNAGLWVFFSSAAKTLLESREWSPLNRSILTQHKKASFESIQGVRSGLLALNASWFLKDLKELSDAGVSDPTIVSAGKLMDIRSAYGDSALALILAGSFLVDPRVEKAMRESMPD